jgi:hypothetical protein
MSKFRLRKKILRKYLFPDILNGPFVAALPNLIWVCDLAPLDMIISRTQKQAKKAHIPRTLEPQVLCSSL